MSWGIDRNEDGGAIEVRGAKTSRHRTESTRAYNAEVETRVRAPELLILLDCIGASREAPADRLSSLDSLDWRKFLDLASWHGLAGQAREALDREELRRHVPAEVVAKLRESSDRTRASYRVLESELRDVLTVLDSEDIPVILLKGLALAEPVYADPGLRPMGDLDLMVQEADLERADHLVRGLGYVDMDDPAGHEAIRQAHRHYPRLAKQGGGCEIELHRHILRADTPLFFDVTSLWSRARPSDVGGRGALVLAPEDLLTHLCLAFFFDRRLFYQSHRALGQLVDVARTVAHYGGELDWDLFLRLARRHRRAGPLFCALWTSSSLLRAKVPEEVLHELEPEPFSPELGEWFIDRKVLERRPWFFHQLVSPSENTISNFLRSGLRRFVFNRGYLEEKYGRPGATTPAAYLALRHGLDLLLMLKRYLPRPGQLARDFRIDRWMHVLETGGVSQPPRPPPP